MTKPASDRILVAGCGAVGSVFACLLAEHGARVHVLGRGEHFDAISRDGIRVEGIWGTHVARPELAATTGAGLAASYEAILISCKSFQTAALVAELGSLRLGDAGAAISLQNGLGNWEHLAGTFGTSRALAGRVIFGAEVISPGVVRVTVEAEPVLLGSPVAGAEPAAKWADLFASAGIRTCATADIVAALWGKVFYNAALNPMGALLGLRYGELASDPLRRRVMDRIVEEAFAVARAQGVRLPWASPAEYLAHFYARLVPATADHRSSMLQDLERGRPTEIDAICGEVCRRGETAGVDVPTHRTLLALLRGRGGH